jgi:hypothetical protein
VETLLAAATPAGTNLIGLVSGGADASTRYNGATPLTPKFANIDVASSGDNQLVAAVSGKTLRVLSVFLAASGAVDAVFTTEPRTCWAGRGRSSWTIPERWGRVGLCCRRTARGGSRPER